MATKGPEAKTTPPDQEATFLSPSQAGIENAQEATNQAAAAIAAPKPTPTLGSIRLLTLIEEFLLRGEYGSTISALDIGNFPENAFSDEDAAWAVIQSILLKIERYFPLLADSVHDFEKGKITFQQMTGIVELKMTTPWYKEKDADFDPVKFVKDTLASPPDPKSYSIVPPVDPSIVPETALTNPLVAWRIINQLFANPTFTGLSIAIQQYERGEVLWESVELICLALLESPLLTTRQKLPLEILMNYNKANYPLAETCFLKYTELKQPEDEFKEQVDAKIGRLILRVVQEHIIHIMRSGGVDEDMFSSGLYESPKEMDCPFNTKNLAEIIKQLQTGKSEVFHSNGEILSGIKSMLSNLAAKHAETFNILELTATIEQMAGLEALRGNYGEADKLFQALITKREEGPERIITQGVKKYGDMLIVIGMKFEHAGNRQSALKHYKQALDIYDRGIKFIGKKWPDDNYNSILRSQAIRAIAKIRKLLPAEITENNPRDTIRDLLQKAIDHFEYINSHIQQLAIFEDPECGYYAAHIGEILKSVIDLNLEIKTLSNELLLPVLKDLSKFNDSPELIAYVLFKYPLLYPELSQLGIGFAKKITNSNALVQMERTEKLDCIRKLMSIIPNNPRITAELIRLRQEQDSQQIGEEKKGTEDTTARPPSTRIGDPHLIRTEVSDPRGRPRKPKDL